MLHACCPRWRFATLRELAYAVDVEAAGINCWENAYNARECGIGAAQRSYRPALSREEALRIMREASVTVGPVYSIADAMDDVHFREREIIVDAVISQDGRTLELCLDDGYGEKTWEAIAIPA